MAGAVILTPFIQLQAIDYSLSFRYNNMQPVYLVQAMHGISHTSYIGKGVGVVIF